MTAPIRVLIVDDHTVVRDGLQALISAEAGMQVVGAAADGIEAVRLARELNPDVILLDLVMPRMDGVQTTLEIKRDNPEARILVLTSFAEDHQVFSAIKSGAMGYLMKDTSSEELIQAIRDTYHYRPAMQPKIARKLMQDIQSQDTKENENALTEREIEILQLVALGKTNQDIARQLIIAPGTVKAHTASIYRKLDVANRTEAVARARQFGLLP